MIKDLVLALNPPKPSEEGFLFYVKTISKTQKDF